MGTGTSGAVDARAYLRRGVRVAPPWLAKLLVAAALGAHAAVWGTDAPLGRALVLGLALSALGIGWVAWAAWTLRRAGTPVSLRAEPRVFVDAGPYRVGRHPMYLGATVAIGGAAVALGSPLLLLAAGVFWLVVARLHVPSEEAMLRRRFGGWYSDYAADVRRWF
jgi:protein-S-isoprenylcysteine O-methyltransferase Ste14